MKRKKLEISTMALSAFIIGMCAFIFFADFNLRKLNPINWHWPNDPKDFRRKKALGIIYLIVLIFMANAIVILFLKNTIPAIQIGFMAIIVLLALIGMVLVIFMNQGKKGMKMFIVANSFLGAILITLDLLNGDDITNSIIIACFHVIPFAYIISRKWQRRED